MGEKYTFSGIHDLSIRNGRCALLSELKMSLSECEEQIRGIEYHSYCDEIWQYRNTDSDMEKLNIPYFNLPFYVHVVLYNEIPSVEELLREYFKLYKGEICREGSEVVFHGNRYPFVDFFSRFLSAYPSLVRDLHFYLVLRSCEIFEDIEWSFIEDTFGGKDVVVRYDKQLFDISLFVGTERAKNFKELKNNKRHEYDEEHSMELPLLREGAYKLGAFDLYGESHLIKVLDFVYQKVGKIGVCRKCWRGHLVPKTGRNGDFLGCSRYPDCNYTVDGVGGS